VEDGWLTGVSRPFGGATGVSSLWLDDAGQTLFWTEAESVVSASTRDAADVAIVAEHQRCPGNVTADGSLVYWTNVGFGDSDGWVMAKSSSDERSGVLLDSLGTRSVAAADGYVYWIQFPDSIARLRR